MCCPKGVFVRGAAVAAAAVGRDMDPPPQEEQPRERDCLLMWRREWTVNRAVSVLAGRIPLYTGPDALSIGSRPVEGFCRDSRL